MLSEKEILMRIEPCKEHLILDRDVEYFHECIEEKTVDLGIKWSRVDSVLVDDEGNIIRVLAQYVRESDVVSILAYYGVLENGTFVFKFIDVDISNIDDVKRVMPVKTSVDSA